MAATGTNRGWRLVGYAGELLLTLGVVLVLFVVYQLWWTNVAAARAAATASAHIRQQWSAATPTATPSPSTTVAPEAPGVPDPEVEQPEVGATIGLMYIPRLRSHVWGMPLVQGVAAAELAQGIGHYPGTAMPGEIGNFATAGHRATNGEPLRDIDQLRAGDVVIVETEHGWYTYQLDEYQIVNPEDVWVIDPVPGQPPGTTPTEALITLTTCHPRWGSTERFIRWGHLVSTTPRSDGPPAALQ